MSITNLGQVLLTAAVTAVVGLLVMESYQTTPWLADKLMRWSVRVRYTDNPERATIREEELISLLEDLPTLFKLPTAVGFLLRAFAYRLANCRNNARREPRAGQRSLGARFRIALVKASLVAVCISTVFGIELAFDNIAIFPPILWLDSGAIVVLSLGAGILGAIVSAARLPSFDHGLIGGITAAFFLYAWTLSGLYWVWPPSYDLGMDQIPLSGGIAVEVAIALTSTLVRKSKYVGLAIGVLLNIVGMMLILPAGVLFLNGFLPLNVVAWCGLGFAAGALAGFATAVERCAREKYPPLISARRPPGTPIFEAMPGLGGGRGDDTSPAPFLADRSALPDLIGPTRRGGWVYAKPVRLAAVMGGALALAAGLPRAPVILPGEPNGDGELS